MKQQTERQRGMPLPLVGAIAIGVLASAVAPFQSRALPAFGTAVCAWCLIALSWRRSGQAATWYCTTGFGLFALASAAALVRLVYSGTQHVYVLAAAVLGAMAVASIEAARLSWMYGHANVTSDKP